MTSVTALEMESERHPPIPGAIPFDNDKWLCPTCSSDDRVCCELELMGCDFCDIAFDDDTCNACNGESGWICIGCCGPYSGDSMTSDPKRKTELARIHATMAELGMDDETYRDMLEQVVGVRSASKLDRAGRAKVLDRLRALGAKGTPKGRPHNMDSAERGPLLSKVEALLADQKLSWAYGDAIARQMYRRDRLTFCDTDQLRAVVVALTKRAAKQKAANE